MSVVYVVLHVLFSLNYQTTPYLREGGQLECEHYSAARLPDNALGGTARLPTARSWTGCVWTARLLGQLACSQLACEQLALVDSSPLWTSPCVWAD